jgi:hypothetical protein
MEVEVIMATNSYQGRQTLDEFTRNLRINRGMAFGVIIITALLAFELFNYSTTDFALSDLLGDLKFVGIRWATILSIAFCSIDFAGIARLFTPEGGADPHKEVWYLFGAWMLAAIMNAMLTWWGVSIAILNHETLGNAVVERTTLLRVVPIFVAVLVWVIRVLIIGTFSVAGDRLFSSDRTQASTYRNTTARQPITSRSIGRPSRSNRQNNRKLPATRSAKPNRTVFDRTSTNNQQLNRGFTSSPKPSEANQSSTKSNLEIPPDPEYIGIDQPYAPTITAAPSNNIRQSSGTIREISRPHQTSIRR